MRLTRFTDYSLRVLIHLGQHTESRVTIHQIAEAHNISKNHLMKVVSNLTRLQFVVARRGPGGGIQLNRAPEDISIGEVVSKTEKHLHRPANPDISEIKSSAELLLGDYLQAALQAYVDALGRFTLADVLNTKSDAPEILSLKEKAA